MPSSANVEGSGTVLYFSRQSTGAFISRCFFGLAAQTRFCLQAEKFATRDAHEARTKQEVARRTMAAGL
jgi:hypothetical protein